MMTVGKRSRDGGSWGQRFVGQEAQDARVGSMAFNARSIVSDRHKEPGRFPAGERRIRSKRPGRYCPTRSGA
jgi:hypothetical protein